MEPRKIWKAQSALVPIRAQLNGRSNTPNELSKTFTTDARQAKSASVTGRIIFTGQGQRVIRRDDEGGLKTLPTIPPEKIILTSLDEFIMMFTVGQGAYATVKTVKHKVTGVVYVLKTYDKHNLIDPMRKRAVQREIRVLKQVDHPNIIKFHNCITTQKQVHLLWDYIIGSSLAKVLKNKYQRKFPEAEAKDIFRQVVHAVDYCHTNSIAHQDLKLDNILLDSNNDIKIIDFGFSMVVPCKSNVWCGTPSYMAPEIIMKKDGFNIESDVWALGIILHVMLTGVFPFIGQARRDLYGKIIRGKYTEEEDLGDEVRELIHSILQIEPKRRPTTGQILEHPWLSTDQASAKTRKEVKPQLKTDKSIGNVVINDIVMLGYKKTEVTTALQDNTSHISILYKRLLEARKGLILR